jgi:hypothetical protein
VESFRWSIDVQSRSGAESTVKASAARTEDAEEWPGDPTGVTENAALGE